MVYGFLNEVAAGEAAAKPNSLESCRSVGHIEAFERGFSR